MAFWSICEPRCRNEAYNASFGARTSWKKIWPEIAGYFNMPVEYSTHAQCVGRITRDFPRIWSDMCRQSGVTFPNFDEVCKPAFMDQEFMVNWDAGYSPEKSRAHGYTKSIDPQSMFHRFFDRLVEQKVIPDPNYRKRLWQSPSIRALHSDQAKITR
jgi:hypothetical protein